MGSYSGICRDGTNYVSISTEGINKDDYRWLLKNCPYQHYADSDPYCTAVPIVGTVEGSRAIKLKNAYIYELCIKRAPARVGLGLTGEGAG
jgi:hypothetical protein